MKNNYLFIVLIFKIFFSTIVVSNGTEPFNFDVTEIEITENGNKFRGYNRGKIKTDNGIVIDADEFDYDKPLNILNANGNVKIVDEVNNYTIYTNDITYFKNDEKIFTKGYSKGVNEEVTIESNKFIYDKNLNILTATDDVKIDDKQEDIQIYSDHITYYKNKEEIYTKGKTRALIQQKYDFLSSDVFIDKDKMEISSKNKTQILDDNSNFYELGEFIYFKNEFLLKAKKVNITSSDNLPEDSSDKYYFADGFFNLDTKNFDASNTEIYLHKNVYGNEDNDPRLKGVSSFKKNNITQINKGVFTSCKKSDGCPPWSMQAQKIKHNQDRKQIIYDNALLKIYDVPVVYFPKFFHPDPSVERQSGTLVPQTNQSQILGSSIQIPYFHVISKDKDITFRPNIFDKDIYMLQAEYREKKENSALIADFAFVDGYKSSTSNKKNSISHLFAKYKLNLNLDNYIKSDLNLNFAKVTNDTYLKVFDGNLFDTTIKPDQNKLASSLSINLEHEDFNFSGGVEGYENLSGKSSDRYQYILPYYNFSKQFIIDSNLSTLSFNSSGSNNLKNTNNLRSRIINNAHFASSDLISNLGIKNNLNIHFKNLNTVAKNDADYKSSPQVELMSIFEAKSSLPMIKYTENYDSYLEPKISFRFNPGHMKDYSSSGRRISVANVFDINRLGISDAYEEGKSLTIGLDYKKEKIEDINKYFEFKLATVLREGTEEKIPNSSTIKQSGNLLGQIKNNLNDHIELIYDFSTDNDLHTLEYNSLETNFTFDKFFTSFRFVEENGKIGDTNSIENTLRYNFDENNYLSFNTRRNRKINFTEYYNLIYEYANDCLTAGIKYNKTFYQDRDYKPTHDILFSLTIFPLTTYEKRFDTNR